MSLYSTVPVPLVKLHGSVINKMLVHIERIEQHVRLMTHALAQTLKFSLVEVVLEYRHVIRMSTLLDDDTGTLARRQTTNVGKTLLRNNNVEIVLGLVYVSAHGNDARHTSRVGLAGASGGSVHDGVFC